MNRRVHSKDARREIGVVKDGRIVTRSLHAHKRSAVRNVVHNRRGLSDARYLHAIFFSLRESSTGYAPIINSFSTA